MTARYLTLEQVCSPPLVDGLKYVRHVPRPWHWERVGYVYFAEAVGSGRVKIGWSLRGGEARAESFHTACPYEIELLGHVRGTIKDEHRIHAIFATDRIFPNKEWFFDSPKLREFLSVNRVKGRLK